MQITVQYTGQLANLAGAAQETLQVEEGTRLKPVVDRLAERHGPAYADLVLDSDGALRPSLLVVLDGEQAEGDKAQLTLDGVQTLMLMTPIAGG